MKIIYIFFLTFLLANCQRHDVVKNHGVSYLEKREKLIIVKKSNKNDTIKVLGQPASKGMSDDNLWIYIERTITRGKLLKLGRNYTKKNNVLLLEFDKFGMLVKKEFYNKEDMKKLNFAKAITENDIKKENFVYGFLSSIRQKMQSKRK